MSHTPGPWKIQREYGLRQRIQQANDGGTIAYMTSRPFAHGGNFSHEQITDNARLISAAPELLEALKHMGWCLPCSEGAWESCEGGRAALAAIAKAEGK